MYKIPGGTAHNVIFRPMPWVSNYNKMASKIPEVVKITPSLNFKRMKLFSNISRLSVIQTFGAAALQMQRSWGWGNYNAALPAGWQNIKCSEAEFLRRSSSITKPFTIYSFRFRLAH
jgi:hypothetical protein